MDGGVVYAAWLAGRWQLIAMDRPRRVARLSIGGRDVAARGGTYSTVAVGWADSFTELRGNGGGVRHGRIPSDRQQLGNGRSRVVYCARTPLGTNGVGMCGRR